MKRLLLVLLCLLLVGGCANIPLESQPVVVSRDKPAQAPVDVPDPPKDLDALSVAREFVLASAKPGNAYAASRVFLANDERVKWKPAQELTVIGNTFRTTYLPDEQGRVPDPNQQTVVVRGSAVGTLTTSKSFIPSPVSSYEAQLKVRKQADGQWRIVDPPQNLAITGQGFSDNYSRLAIYFYSADSGAFVPDLRYVPTKPASGLPLRVVDLLLKGPSEGLSGAVQNLVGDQASTETNVKSADDGSVVVPLAGVSTLSPDAKNLVAAQIVLSLQSVTPSRVRLLSDGAPLVPGKEYLRASELPAYNVGVAPGSDLPGLMTVGNRILSLGDGAPVAGPAGNGGYDVSSAAQSVDGKRLAVVERSGGGVRLRIGDLGRDLPLAGLTGGSMTRPTWRTSPAGGGASGELWTVVDQSIVARLSLAPGGNWAQSGVNANELTTLGPISQLRLSRDGARVAAVINGQLLVATIVRTPDSVTLRAPRILQPQELQDVVDVDWASQETLVVATSSTTLPVVRVPVDGQRKDSFNSSNLSPPVHGVAAAPNRQTVVADAGGLWVATELGEVWRPQAHTLADAYPFYPG
ncbi:LpqB family beta-propeller domain-containing protein [Amycolatopsis sp. H20-H5]|uniref:LpqB family beta-propeller domain-containing protein n=1 Tax=Amycolatopsis sp. H20-H5 TaxID=3046309 RepID=UPI002DB62AA0|nr:LpqB family beta-propeller domain-containing protein [Amycolatopsis sp. H20-H5]MEC3980676.1 LpqB family beta-propeller domain-containing protein [Amycolatopsis sp. H20-H5]